MRRGVGEKRKTLWGLELKNFAKCGFFESHRGHGGHRDLRVGSRMEGKMFTTYEELKVK